MSCKIFCLVCRLLAVSTQTLHPVTVRAAANVKLLLDKYDISQARAGEVADVSGPQMSKLLRPAETDQIFSLPQLGRLADYFGVPVELLFGPDYELLRFLARRDDESITRRSHNRELVSQAA